MSVFLGILTNIAKWIKRNPCERLVEYTGQEITVTGLSAGSGSFKIDLGGFSNKIKEINAVPQVMMALDTNQYLLCRQASDSDCPSTLREECLRIRLMHILGFSQLQAILSIPKPDRNLRTEITRWIRYMNVLVQDCALWTII